MASRVNFSQETCQVQSLPISAEAYDIMRNCSENCLPLFTKPWDYSSALSLPLSRASSHFQHHLCYMMTELFHSQYVLSLCHRYALLKPEVFKHFLHPDLHGLVSVSQDTPWGYHLDQLRIEKAVVFKAAENNRNISRMWVSLTCAFLASTCSCVIICQFTTKKGKARSKNKPEKVFCAGHFTSQSPS